MIFRANKEEATVLLRQFTPISVIQPLLFLGFIKKNYDNEQKRIIVPCLVFVKAFDKVDNSIFKKILSNFEVGGILLLLDQTIV